MKKIGRITFLLCLGAVIQTAGAQANFSVVNDSYTLDTSGPFLFNFIPDNVNMSVNFIPTAPAFKVGDSTPYGSGVATIIYNVTTSVPINGIDLTFQGDVELWGEINWTETAEVGLNNIGSVNGTVRGSMYTGGTDGAFTRTARLNFSQAVTSFTVKKTFDIDIAANRPPSQSLAAVSLIEQQLRPVPEPASLAGLALGAIALIRRRKK